MEHGVSGCGGFVHIQDAECVFFFFLFEQTDVAPHSDRLLPKPCICTLINKVSVRGFYITVLVNAFSVREDRLGTPCVLKI